jgi:hypothetical protein
MFKTFRTVNGEVELNAAMIVSVRPTMKSELPGKSVISTLDCKIHIVDHTIAEIRSMLDENAEAGA